jgi:hypothetical protein
VTEVKEIKRREDIEHILEIKGGFGRDGHIPGLALILVNGSDVRHNGHKPFSTSNRCDMGWLW